MIMNISMVLKIFTSFAWLNEKRKTGNRKNEKGKRRCFMVALSNQPITGIFFTRVFIPFILFSASKKTKLFLVFDKNRARELNEVKTSKIRHAKFLKPGSLLSVNDCFKNEHNAIFGVFLQRLFITPFPEKKWTNAYLLLTIV